MRTYRWIYGNKDGAIEAASAVAKVKKKFGARGYEIYTKRHVWPFDGSPAVEGMRVVLDYPPEAG